MTRTLVRWLPFLGVLCLFLCLTRPVAAQGPQCPPGFVWQRLSGVGCVQGDCLQIPNAHLSYEGHCICNEGYVGCYEPVDYAQFDGNKCKPFCPASRLVQCVPKGSLCPGQVAATATPAPTATRAKPAPSVTATRPTSTATQDCDVFCKAPNGAQAVGWGQAPGCECDCLSSYERSQVHGGK